MSPPPGSLPLPPAIMWSPQSSYFQFTVWFLWTESPFHIIVAPGLSQHRAYALSLILASGINAPTSCRKRFLGPIPARYQALPWYLHSTLGLSLGRFPASPVAVCITIRGQRCSNTGIFTRVLQRRRTVGSERLSNFPEVTQLKSGSQGVPLVSIWIQSPRTFHCPVSPIASAWCLLPGRARERSTVGSEGRIQL